MIILPLHHRIERRHLPWMSLLLALACIVVYLGPQREDQARWQRASAQYADAGLADIEAPLYRAWTGEASVDPEAMEWLMQRDRAFRHALASGEAFDSASAHAAWLARSAPFRETLASLVEARFAMHTATPSMAGALGSTFLHGDAGHLIGNLVFLLVMGLLVERATGPWLFLFLYLLSGVAAAWAFVLAWDGPATTLVGASGAIAGLMGALCVLWGRRRIRFFYWFIVVFDYVRAPALWLLPAWLGWELLQAATDDASNVAYEAHAGGIVAGAALAFAIKALRWDRKDAYEDPVEATRDPGAALAEAQACLGRLDFAGVDRALAPLLAEPPVPLDARLLALRASLLAKRAAVADEHALALLAHGRAADRGRVLEALAQWRDAGGRWPPDQVFAYAQLLVLGDRSAEAATLLSEATRVGSLPSDWAPRWLRLAFDRRREGDEPGARQLFAALSQALPETPEAAKAGAQLAG